MEKTTAIQRLDWVLEWFATSGLVKNGATHDTVYKTVKEAHVELQEIDDWGVELNKILNKLIDDNYVELVPEVKITSTAPPGERSFVPIRLNPKMYRVTFEGDLFWSMGGYGGQVSRENAALSHQAMEAQRRSSEYERNRLMFWITVLIAVSTFVQASKDFLDIVNGDQAPHSIEIISFLFVFLAGVLSILCIWLIAEEVRKRRNK